MPWELEIHHIDVGQGESTLIVAKDTATPANNRAALIDGGQCGQSGIILDYLASKNITSVNVMVASHYDKDHLGGLRALLKNTSTHIFDNSLIFDRGEQGNVDNHGTITGMNRKNEYIDYVNQIARLPNRKRLTDNLVSNYNVMALPPRWQLGSALVGKEILWRGPDPNYPIPNPINTIGVPIAKPNAAAPTMTCIAADYYIINEQDNIQKVDAGLGDLENRLCLAFVIKFGNFRYYTGGDVESPQEVVIAKHLNKTNDNAGKISAFKVSHHGSAKSTTLLFTNRLGAKAAFISVGEVAQFGEENLPTQVVINNLQNGATIQNYFLTACGYDRTHVEKVDMNVLQAGKSRVAGGYDRKRVLKAYQKVDKSGDIVLKVTEQQSMQNPAQFNVSYWNTNLRRIDTIPF